MEYYVYNGTLRARGEFPNGKIGAILESIAKWEFIADYIAENDELITDGGAETCALCRKYCCEHPDVFCKRCPIRKFTGQIGCRKTPYHDYERAFISGNTVECIKQAKREVGFLKKVLAAERKKIPQ